MRKRMTLLVAGLLLTAAFGTQASGAQLQAQIVQTPDNACYLVTTDSSGRVLTIRQIACPAGPTDS
jgi:hypothetical protein